MLIFRKRYVFSVKLCGTNYYNVFIIIYLFIKVQELVNLQENLKELESKKEKYAEELKELEAGVGPLEKDLKEKQNAKNEVVKESRLRFSSIFSLIAPIVKQFI